MAKLEEYRRKRRFERTPEPAGEIASQPGRRFVVQKHSARRLHYDFRLEMDGALKSWAVPKGPSLNPADKRLAVQTEDHPLEYAQFEGTIPEGSYGAGTVMVWDRGTYALVGDAAGRRLAKEELKFTLHGEKLRGGFALVKMRHTEKGNEWLLIKHKDGADPNWKIEEHDGSVLTGRTLEEIAEKLPPKRAPLPISPEELDGARKAAMPAKLEPMLATLAERPFSGAEWIFEIKWDGVRALAWIRDGEVELRSRAGRSILAQYPELKVVPQRLQARQAILDGEIVALDDRGHGDFEKLQERMHVNAPPANLVAKLPVIYYVFDLLYCDGYDLRGAPLLQRKELLRRLLEPLDPVRYCDYVAEKGKEFFELARERGLEGVVAKRADGLYVSSRSGHWLKLKTRQEMDAVVGGWTDPRGTREHFGSLLVGLYEGKKLDFVGHVGSGFSQKTQEVISKQLAALAVEQCPFAVVPETNEPAHWLRPELVARVEYSAWTQERRLRHPVFVGLREDMKPEDCRLAAEASKQFPATEPATPTAAPLVVAGRVLAKKAQIEAELFKGRSESAIIELDGKRVRLTHLNKVYFPEPGYTKRNLLAYYYRIADYLLPFLRNHPLVLRRYPDGITGLSFFQKDAGEGVPDWLETVTIPSESKREEIRYVVANDLAALLLLTNLGCIDHNPWPSPCDDLEHPDYFFFDLDPSEGTDFSVVVEVAQALCRKLDELRVRVFLKTSGATGMHLYIPVERRYTYEQVRMFAEVVARLVAVEKASLVTQERSVAKRPKGKVLIDVSQNAFGRPLAAPYVARPFPKAPVSAPIEPGELRRTLRPENLNIETIFKRLEKKADLWADFEKKRQGLEGPTARLGTRVPGKAKP